MGNAVGRFATAGVTDVVVAGAMTATADGARNFHAYAATATSNKKANATNAFAPAKPLMPAAFDPADDAAAHVEEQARRLGAPALVRAMEGLGAATLQACEGVATLAGSGHIQSLNVAATAAILIHELTRAGQPRR